MTPVLSRLFPFLFTSGSCTKHKWSTGYEMECDDEGRVFMRHSCLRCDHIGPWIPWAERIHWRCANGILDPFLYFGGKPSLFNHVRVFLYWASYRSLLCMVVLCATILIAVFLLLQFGY